MVDQRDVLEELPLTEATFLILLSLGRGKKHGYRIMREVESLSDGRSTLSTGTLYGALGRLLDQGWIQRVEEPDKTGRARKVYCLTDLGRRILAAETERLRTLLRAANAELAGGLA